MSDIYECSNCAHIYRHYTGDIIEYHQMHYRNLERRDPNEINLNGDVTPLYHEKRKETCINRIKHISKYLNKSDICLDIGAGAGTFAYQLAPLVSDIECTELAPCLINEIKSLEFKVYERDFLQIEFDKKYDVVFAWHVLEHINDPEKFLLKTKKISNKYVIIEVPLFAALNGKGRQRKLKPIMYRGYFDGHAHMFCEKSFRTMAEKYFNIIELKEGIQSPALMAIMEMK